MIVAFILLDMTQTMPRRTISIPESTEALVLDHVRDGESFSATVVRLVELGAIEDVEFEPADEEEFPLGYIGIGKGGPPDLSINAEKYLGLEPWGPGEGPSEGTGDEDNR
jgi:hypothetical protein